MHAFAEGVGGMLSRENAKIVVFLFIFGSQFVLHNFLNLKFLVFI